MKIWYSDIVIPSDIMVGLYEILKSMEWINQILFIEWELFWCGRIVQWRDKYGWYKFILVVFLCTICFVVLL